MALSTQSANLVRQKAYNAAQSADPYVYDALKAFFRHWAQQKSNGDLQFVPISAADAVAGDGQDHGIDAAHQVYFVYVKKANEGTDTWYRLIDDADNDSEVVGDVRLEVALLDGNDYFVGAYPEGLAMADGLVSTFTTTPGDTATQSAEGAAGNGFIIIGA